MNECCHEKKIKRDEDLTKNIDIRINKVIGQLNGIKKMVDENKYCADVIMQISAAQSALQNIGYLVLNDHLSSCVKDKIIQGDDEIISETMTLIRRLNK